MLVATKARCIYSRRMTTRMLTRLEQRRPGTLLRCLGGMTGGSEFLDLFKLATPSGDHARKTEVTEESFGG